MSSNQPLRLTELADCAGCAAKIGADLLAQVLSPLRQRMAPSQLLVGLGAIDDAAVYQVNEHQAIISTADFFPPVVDDPYTFGSIAAANVLSEVLRGGMDIVEQAGSVIAGGHSISDREPKYGLAVTGLVHPDHILTKGGARPGDVL